MKPKAIPSAILYVNGIIKTIRNAGIASEISSREICLIFCAINTPTIIRIGLIAVFGIYEIQGIIKMVARNNKLAVIATLPVLPFDAITAAFSAADIVGEVPKKAQVNVEKAVTLYADS